MKTPKALEPLWVISFDNSLKGTIKDKAFFCISFPHHTHGTLNDSEQFALDFLQQINKSFRQMTEQYLDQADLNTDQQVQADEIREKFKSFDLWMEWLEKWQNEQNPPPPDEENPL